MNRTGYKEQNTQLRCWNCQDRDVRTLGQVSLRVSWQSLRLQGSCWSFQHLIFPLPHWKAGNMRGDKKRLSSQNDPSGQTRKSFPVPSFRRLSFISHFQNQWDEPTVGQSLGLPRNYYWRLQIIWIPTLCMFLNSWIKLWFLSKKQQGQGDCWVMPASLANRLDSLLLVKPRNRIHST